AAHDAHRVGLSIVELQGSLSRDVAVLAAGVLEHGPHRFERGQAFFLRHRRRARRRDGQERRRGGQGGRGGNRSAHIWVVADGLHGGPPDVVHASRNGSWRSRLPVAANIALATAGATGGTPGSPIPPAFSALETMCTSTSGISFSRRIG